MRNGREIPAAALYKKYNIWHYHCGPTYNEPISYDHQVTDSLLSHNEFGRKSPEVYHYAKQDDVIIVLGYSRLHKPFPDPESRSNPVGNRGLNLAAAIPKK
jgi:hypothetical protein